MTNFPIPTKVQVTKHAFHQFKRRFPGVLPDVDIDKYLAEIALRGKIWNVPEVKGDVLTLARAAGDVVVFLCVNKNHDGTFEDKMYVTTVGDTSRRSGVW